jgi:serine/threonine protein kinase
MGQSPNVRAEALLGKVLRRRWTLEREIGSGGTAAIYAATHRNGSRVAIKVLHPFLQTDPAVRQRFLREGYLANRIGVPDVVKVLDDDVEGNLAYLVMELLEGATIEALRQRAGGRLAAADVVEIGCRLLRVVEAGHARGVLHRDIKPANLFRTIDPVGFKVLDFGIAKALEPGLTPGEQDGSNDDDRFIGTPAFMAPEQVRSLGEELDERTDLWAVGATLFTLLTGRHVHPGETTTELVHHAGTRYARPLRAELASAPSELAALIDRALAFDRNARFASATEMKLACEDCRRAREANGERSAFFSPRGLSNLRAATTGRASTPPEPSDERRSGVRIAPAEPRAGFWSGRVGRLWWFHYSGPCTDETWRQYLDMVQQMLDTGNESTLACFAHQAAAPTPLQRKQMADFIETNRAALAARLDRFALVIDSVVHRHAITALSWLVKKPFEERIFNSPVAAIKWLTEKHAELDAEAVRASIVAQVPRHSLWTALRSEEAETVEGAALR